MSDIPFLEWSESQKLAIMKKYGRVEKTLREDVESIRTWMEKQPHLPEIADKRVIETFLVMNKFRIEDTKKRLDMYYTVRSIIPEFFNKNPNDPSMQHINEAIYFVPLPKLTKELLRVVIIKVEDPNTDCGAIEYIAHTLNVTEIRLRHDWNIGEIHIYDFAELKINFLAKFTPSILRKAKFVIEKMLSNRAQGIHLINYSSFMDSFITIFKSLLIDKLSQKVFIHKDLMSLYNMVPKEILPEEYGGEERSLKDLHNQWNKLLLENDSLFKHLHGLKVNENLRHNKQFDDNLLELQGNFRQLSVD